ncbi:DMT family transporter [Leuconostoc palmae]|uniref:DMT family transporter n=1 Tax=Leuconostoc palmae TaxID=501487 RepID=UPI001C7CA95B|nr:DMT family transporter [Leuconostoc palmae]
MLYVLGLIAGFTLANQSPINAKLGSLLRSPFRSSLLSFTVGTIFLIICYVFSDQKMNPITNVAVSNPWWIWSGGFLGVIFLTSNILMFPKLGAIQTIILPIIGQVMMSLLIDTFGWFSIKPIPLTMSRLIAVVLTNRSSLDNKLVHNQINSHINSWRVWGVIVGAISALQQAINGRVGHLINSPIASAGMSFLIGTIFIFFIVLIKEHSILPPNIHILSKPKWLFTGGILGAFFVFSTTFLVPILGAGMTVTLGLSGSIIGSIVVSQFGLWQSPKQVVSRFQIIGILVMLGSITLIKFS